MEEMESLLPLGLWWCQPCPTLCDPMDIQAHTCIDKYYHRLDLWIALLETLFLFPKAHESLFRPLPYPY